MNSESPLSLDSSFHSSESTAYSDLSRSIYCNGSISQEFKAACLPMPSSPPAFDTANYAEPIAVVGIACRFAQASSPSELWTVIKEGRSGHSEIPERSWQPRAWYHPSRDRAGQICTTSGYFLDDVEAFDAPFFSISAREAAAMDPMQRLGLEIAYEAFESAGMPAEKLSKSATGVYSASMTNDYQMLAERDPYRLEINSAAGTGKSMLSNRISWFFDLQGPSLTLDTACSSSLYAMHLACQSIRTGECRQALVTGHNLILHPTFFSQLSSMHMVSPDGVSHSFDAAANGYGRGEGIAGVVIKNLSAAIADGDVIRALIRATGVGSDGKTPGITVPSAEAQASLIRKVYEAARLDMALTAYFETHGTGTAVGDPIEIEAVSQTVGKARSTRGLGPLFVGSVKPNIGHTEGCAGLAGLIKAVLCLEAGMIPPIGGLVDLNPKLKEHHENGHLEFPTGGCRPWPTGVLRRASVNSFGFGGANAHAVVDAAGYYAEAIVIRGMRHITRSLGNLQEIVSREPESKSGSGDEDGGPLLFVVSSFDRKGLGRNAKSLGVFVKENESVNPKSLSYILASKRTMHSFRSFAIATSRDDLAQKLLGDTTNQNQQQPQLPEFHSPHARRPLVFCFTGQGAQRPGMAAELLQSNRFPVFTASIAYSQEVLQSLGCEWDLVELLTKNRDVEFINDPRRSQPACTAVQIALVHLLAHWGVTPSAVTGHSSGEIVAAHAAGAVSHRDAIRVAYYRGLLSAQVVSRLDGRLGSMLAAGLSETETRAFLAEHDPEGEITVACINSPRSVTLSGEASAMSRIEQALRKAGHFARGLRTGGVAYHSPYMDKVGGDFVEAVGSFDSTGPKEEHICGSLNVPMYSSVTEGPIVDAAVLSSADYWHLNMKSPVRFAGALRNLLLSKNADGSSGGFSNSTVLEIGPSKTLAGPISQIMADITTTSARSSTAGSVQYVSMLSADQDSRNSVLNAAGTLWAIGQPVDLPKVNGLEPSEVKNLRLEELPLFPTYAWDHRKTYWHDTCGFKELAKPRHDLIGVPRLPRNPFQPQWHNVLRIRDLPWLADHAVDGPALFPAAGYLAMAIEAVRALSDERGLPLCGFELSNVQFENGLMIGSSGAQKDGNEDGQAVAISLTAEPHEDMSFVFSVFAASDTADGWRRLATGTVQGVVDSNLESIDFERAARREEWVSAKLPELERISAMANESIDVAAFYSHLASIGLEYGPTFRGLQEIRCRRRNKTERQVEDEESSRGLGSAFGELLVPDTRSTMPHAYEHKAVVHPATLDGIFQLVFAALQSLSHQGSMEHAAIPVSLRRVFISTSTPQAAGSRLVGVATAREQNNPEDDGEETNAGKTIIGNLTFAQQDMSEPSVIVDDIILRFLPRAALDLEKSRGEAAWQAVSEFQRTAKMVWKQDIDQSFAQWKQNLVAGTDSADRHCANLVDLFTHKRAHVCALFVGASPLRASLEQGNHLAGLASCVSISSSVKWREQLGRVTKLQAEGGKFDLLVHQLDGIMSDADLCQLSALVKEACAPDAMVVLLDQGIQASQISWEQWKSDLGKVPALRVFHVSGANCNSDPAPSTDSVDVTELSVTTQDSGHAFGKVYLIARAEKLGGTTSQLVELLSSQLSHMGIDFLYKSLAEAAADPAKLKGQTLISLLEVEAPLVHSWSPDELDACRRIVGSGASYMLWVAVADLLNPYSEISLEYSPTVGFLRSIRAEYPSMSLPYLDLSPETLSQKLEHAAVVILETLRLSATRWSGEKTPESEFAEKDGRLLIPRIIAAPDADMYLATEKSQDQTGPMVHLHPAIDQPWKSLTNDDGSNEGPHLWLRDFGGGGKDARWVLQPSTDAVAGSSTSSSVQIRTTHAAIKETAKSNSSSGDHSLIIAEQTIGIVESLTTQDSPSAHSDIAEGDLVLITTPGPVRHVSTYNIHHGLIRLPKDTIGKSLAPAAFWLGPLAVAFYILSGMARLSETREPSVIIDVVGNTVLLHSLVQASKALGACKVFVIQDGEISLDFKSAIDIDRKVVVVPRMNRQTARLLCASTGGATVVVSNMLRDRPHRLQRLAETISEEGCIVGLDSSPNGDATPSGFDSKVRSVLLRDLYWDSKKHRRGLDDAMAAVLRCLQLGKIHLSDPLETVSASNTRRLAELYTSVSSKNKRRVLEFLPSESVSVYRHVRKQTGTALDSNGTYIISGGLGAIGLRLASMLRELGARHLVLLSRSGQPKMTLEASTEISKLQQSGCHVDVLACDITSEGDMKELGEGLKLSGSRIKGIIQSAMVLNDTTFENMNHAQWEATTAPKIRGSWNLHKLAVIASEDLDFFILLSSMSGVIGNTAQANYCAGNTFEDSLAHHRRARGLTATSLNVGLVSDSGHYGRGTMAAFGDVHEYLAMFGHLSPVVVSMAETLASVKMVIDGTFSPQTLPPQLIVGLSSQVPRAGALLSNWPLDRKFDHRTTPPWLEEEALKDGASAQGASKGKESGSISETLGSAKDLNQAVFVIQQSLQAKIAQIIGVEVDSIDEEKDLSAYGSNLDAKLGGSKL
ncbi:Type I Iterative PKS [Pyricularia oryzae]|nr:Type I Iterative PKS [Pyricularia oryzae]